MHKKILFLWIILISLVNFAFADEIDTEELNMNTLEASSNTSEIPPIYSKHAIAIERLTGTILYEKDGFSQTPMASTTKIMTAILAIENSNLNDMVEISSKAANTEGSTLGIKTGSKLSMKTLLYGLLMRSGNDCAVAIAEYISGSVPEFSNLMNKKAETLNLNNTHFVTPHGLDETNHYTSAYDLALLTNYALQNPIFSKIVNTKTTEIQMDGYSKNIHNTHELLGFLDGVYGVKTGFTGNAGRCLVTACKRKNLDIIVIVLGADTKKIRTTDTINLIEYLYKNFDMVNTLPYLKTGFSIPNIHVSNSLSIPNIYLEKNNNYIFPLNKKHSNFESKIYIFNNLKAPISAGSKVGIIKFYADDVFLYENNILLKNDIKSYSYRECIFIVIKKLKELFLV